MKPWSSLFAHGRTLLACSVMLLLSGCMIASGVTSVVSTAGSLAVSAVSTATSAAYQVGKAGVSVMAP